MTCAPWATSADACDPCTGYDVDTNDLDDCMQVATDVLYEFTKRRWSGSCRDRVRPQARFKAAETPSWWPSDRESRWGYCSCHRPRETGCASVPEIRLPNYPVTRAWVTLDGDDFADFRIDDQRYLVRTDGDGWPCCQDMTAEATEANTFEVEYEYGADPPIGGVQAAASLGCELYLSRHPGGDATCRLPKRVQTITRQGTTIALLDPLKLFADGLTGISEVDLWVASVNRGSAQRRASVLIPGRSKGVRRTAT